MMLTMAKKKDPRKKVYPSRKAIRYVALPLSLYQALEKLAGAEERSVSFMARKAVKEFLERLNPSGESN